MNLSAPKKAKISAVMKPSLMSSDEETEEGFITHQPTWQSEKFKDYKMKLDNTYKKFCSKASLRLLQKRTVGEQSVKDIPDLPEESKWILKNIE